MVALGTHRPGLSAGPRDGFARLLRAEWTKFRTVPGWVITILVAAVLPTGSRCSTWANAVGAPPR